MKKMKVCSRCSEEKPVADYNRRNKNSSSYQPFCKVCNKEYSKEWYKKNKTEHRKRVNENKKILKEQKAAHIVDYLKEHPCIACGESDPIVLEFDHIEENTKYMNVSHMIMDAFRLDRVMEEVAKCQVLCANCHRRKTAKKRGQIRYRLCNSDLTNEVE